MAQQSAAILPTNTADRRATLYALYLVAVHCSDLWSITLARWTRLLPSNEYTVWCCSIAGVARCLYIQTWDLPAIRCHRTSRPESWHAIVTYTKAHEDDFRARLELPPPAVPPPGSLPQACGLPLT